MSTTVIILVVLAVVIALAVGITAFLRRQPSADRPDAPSKANTRPVEPGGDDEQVNRATRRQLQRIEAMSPERQEAIIDEASRRSGGSSAAAPRARNSTAAAKKRAKSKAARKARKRSRR